MASPPQSGPQPAVALSRALRSRFAELAAKLRQNRPADDLSLLDRAFQFAAEQHATQTRSSGEPFLSHPLEVAHILADMKLDVTTLCAALLHDIVEDTKIPNEQISQRFGPDVAKLVEGTTKISRLDFLAPEARQAENVRKMLLAMVDDVRVVVIKLADRLHNMRTLQFLDADKQQRIAAETLDIYAPIAHRLGMGRIRGELEDLAFSYLDSPSFLELQKTVAGKSRAHEKFLQNVQDAIRKKLVENGIPAEVEGRIKRLYSIHRKLERVPRSLDQIYDLLAVRVITDNVKNCYAALGVVHQIWHPVPGRVKDSIAMPRPNLYQSLHTTVLSGGQPFEIQIRTQEMHRIAEQGVAAHWKYKDGAETAASDDQRIIWMRQLIEWVKEMQEPGEFMSTLQVDLYPEEVYTFTPKGRVIVLPRGATPVDFAYAVHTEVGHRCIGAKVNGQISQLRNTLGNGDVVEILTQKNHGPTRDWLSYVCTSRARSKIRHWLNVHERQEATELGRRLVEKEARQFNISLKKIPDEALQRVASEYGCARVEDLYADLGYGKFSPRQVLAKATGQPLMDPPEPPPPQPSLVTAVKRVLGIRDAAVLVRGHDDLMVYRAKCCNPIRGDEIVGYITRGRGVAVHARTCPNVGKLLYESERRIPVEWTGSTDTQFPVRLLIRNKDRTGMIADVTKVISEAGCNIRTLGTRHDGPEYVIDVYLEIAERRQLEKLLASIKKVPGVLDVTRSNRV
ncbi:MAG: bifunctional (p)ppGpp synthetase/guanosine-3',5'-bis(diphosphate) 3'-pyrophosphohydrolase [Acidobacteria bacterium]|nr:bifunctional (p)ppGpp synthetase/guanosine-3',5'-bis(diphosphate) 3'-pyrophosphohydrolase [Acidobacteriota bacterium]